MLLSNPLIVLSLLFAFLGMIFLIITIARIKRWKLLAGATNFVTVLLMLSLSALFGTISVAIQGYHALIREELAAIVKVEPTGEQRFSARFSMPDSSERIFGSDGQGDP